MSSGVGWVPQHIPGKWAQLVLLLFPASFVPFSHLVGMLRAGCTLVWIPPECWLVERSAGIHSPITKASLPRISSCCPPSSHHLNDPSPPAAASSSSLSIFSQLLSLPKGLSEVEGGFNLLENSDLLLLVYPVMIGLVLDSGLGHCFILQLPRAML